MKLYKVSAVAIALAGTLAVAPVQAGGSLKDYGPAPFSWTGFYAGVNAGYGWNRNDQDFFGIGGNTPVFFANREFPTSLSPDSKGFVGGGELGYNIQSGSVVYGIEADFQGSDIGGSAFNRSVPTGGFFPFDTTVDNDLQWFGTVRGRLGIAGDRWLIFGTAGLAYGKVSLGFNTVVSPPLICVFATTCAAASDSSIKSGWAAGAGVEYALTGQWLVRAEYMHIDLGSESVTGVSIIGGPPLATFGTRVHFEYDIVRAGINYKF